MPDDSKKCVDCVVYLSAWPCVQLIGSQRVMCFGVLCQSVQENFLEEFGQGTTEIDATVRCRIWFYFVLFFMYWLQERELPCFRLYFVVP